MEHNNSQQPGMKFPKPGTVKSSDKRGKVLTFLPYTKVSSDMWHNSWPSREAMAWTN